MSQNKTKTTNQRHKIEQMLKVGNYTKVYTFILERMKKSSISGEERIWLADLCKRSGRYYLGLRALKPLIAEKVGGVDNLELSAKVIMAELNTRIGAPQVGLKLLENISSKNVEVIRAKAFSHIYLWQYDQAIPLFNYLLKVIDPMSYEYAIIQLNLLSCYGFILDSDKIQFTYERCVKNYLDLNWSLLLYNTHEIMSGFYVNSGNIEKAKIEFEKAKKIKIKKNRHRYELLLEKWGLVINYRLNKGAIEIEDFIKLKVKSKNYGLWNTVREIDTLTAQCFNQEKLFNQVYYGSPYKLYKDQLKLRMPKFKIQEKFIRGSERNRIFSLAGCCETNGSKTKISPASMSHNLLKCLNFDFYRKMPIGEIFLIYFLISILIQKLLHGEYISQLNDSEKL